MITEQNFVNHLALWYKMDSMINNMSLYEVNRIFCEITNQNIPQNIVDQFLHTGGFNTEYLTGEFLIRRGYKNILQYMKN
jgi:hypothetical protein